MRAFVVEASDRPPEIRDVEEPTLSAGEILMNVFACGLNFADLLMTRDESQERPGFRSRFGSKWRVASRGRERRRRRARRAHRTQRTMGEPLHLPAGRMDPVQAAAAHSPTGPATSPWSGGRESEARHCSCWAADGVGLTAIELGALM